MNLQQLRANAIAHTLFQPAGLQAGITRLNFVQADPIRAPARAQDLILRQRVESYCVGDLERDYASLGIEEDLFFAYGFLPRPIWQLLHPRRTRKLVKLEREVLATVRDLGAVHPRDLEEHFGRKRVVNAWGGHSQATKCALEHLHAAGLLRVARRDNGIRVYEAAPAPLELTSPAQRFRELVVVVVQLLAPIVDKTLSAICASLRRAFPAELDHRATIGDLLRTGELARQTVDGFNYLWPVSEAAAEPPPRTVRLLAPFDPLVRDRIRFEHFWGWSYRFEAYTPPAKRIRGYYAMPLLFGEQVIGWANANVVSGNLNVELGFISKRPKDRHFRNETEAEIARLHAFLKLNTPS